MAGRRSSAMERALQIYARGGRSIAESARLAGVSLRGLRDALRAEGYPPLPATGRPRKR